MIEANLYLAYDFIKKCGFNRYFNGFNILVKLFRSKNLKFKGAKKIEFKPINLYNI